MERRYQSSRTGLKAGKQLLEGAKNPSKRQGGFSSLLPVCAIILGEIPNFGWIPSLAAEGIPHPQVCPCRRCCQSSSGGGERFGLGCGAGVSHA